MNPTHSGVRVWIATDHIDMRPMRSARLCGFNNGDVSATAVSLCRLQQALKRDPHAGDLFMFRGRRGNLVLG